MFSGFRNISIIGLAVLVGLCLAGQPVRAGETIGSFDQVTGEVTVRDRDAKRFPASIGMPLENGYMVKTGQDRTLIHISEPTRPTGVSRMPSSA